MKKSILPLLVALAAAGAKAGRMARVMDKLENEPAATSEPVEFVSSAPHPVGSRERRTPNPRRAKIQDNPFLAE